MLDDTLLEAFMKGFYGYGAWAAKYWFVGLEEGGGQTCDEIARRIETWKKRKRPEIDDIREFHHEACLTDWFGTSAGLQSTWAPLICSVLVAEGKPSDFTSILQYQRTQVGAKNRETTIIERLPLPSPNSDTWNYSQWSSMPALQSPSSYRSAFLKQRSERIVELIKAHTPKVVVFYGDRAGWSKRFRLSDQPGNYRTNVGRFGETLMVATGHPNARTNDTYPRFTAVGEYIAQELRRITQETS